MLLEGGAEIFEIFGNFLDSGFGGAGAGTDANGLCVVEPCRVDVFCAIDEMGGFSFGACGFGEAGGIGRVLRSDDEDDIGAFRYFGNGFLAIGGRIANVFAGRGDDVRVLLCKHLNDLCRFGNAQCGLREVGELFVVVNAERFDIGFGLDERYGFPVGVHRLADYPDAFGVSLVSDIDN